MDNGQTGTNATVIGTKQVLRALERGELRSAVLAEDADPHIREKLTEALNAGQIPYTIHPCMKDLGKSCGIEVGAAVVGTVVKK